jgi:AcrR family transcriptional regulator
MTTAHPHSHSEATRARILQAAQEAFAEHGYDATGMDEICRRAGVSKGAVYHHFAGKQAVLLALLNQWLAGLDAQMAAARSAAGQAPSQLLAMAAAAGPAMALAGEQVGLFLEFWAKAVRDPTVRAAVVEPYHRYQQLFADLVAAGVRDGSLAPTDPQVAARALVGLAMGLLLQQLFEPTLADWPAVATASIELLLNGLRARK